MPAFFTRRCKVRVGEWRQVRLASEVHSLVEVLQLVPDTEKRDLPVCMKVSLDVWQLPPKRMRCRWRP
eukprot:2200555-Amphidinium_carterae.2